MSATNVEVREMYGWLKGTVRAGTIATDASAVRALEVVDARRRTVAARGAHADP